MAFRIFSKEGDAFEGDFRRITPLHYFYIILFMFI